MLKIPPTPTPEPEREPGKIQHHEFTGNVTLFLLDNPIDVAVFGLYAESYLNSVSEKKYLIAAPSSRPIHLLNAFNLKEFQATVGYWSHPNFGGLAFAFDNNAFLAFIARALGMIVKVKVQLYDDIQELKQIYAEAWGQSQVSSTLPAELIKLLLDKEYKEG